MKNIEDYAEENDKAEENDDDSTDEGQIF